MVMENICVFIFLNNEIKYIGATNLERSSTEDKEVVDQFEDCRWLSACRQIYK